MPRLAINLVTYNSAATLPSCIAALDAQSYRHFELTVFDNASGDATLAWLSTRPDITHLAHATNIGYAAAHNWLIDHTTSDYVLTLNPDVALDPHYLADIVAALDANPQAGSAAGCLLRVDHLAETPTQIDSAGLFMRRNRRQGLRLEGRPITEQPTHMETIFGPDGAAACYRRAMLDDIRLGGEVFDTDFFMHKEDVDVCWRAQLRGWSSIFVPGAIARHVRGFRPGQRQHVAGDLRFYSVQNRYLLLIKNEQIAHFARDLILIMAYDLKIVAYLCLFERSSLRALTTVWQLRRKMLAKRRVIQASRRTSWRALRKWFT